MRQKNNKIDNIASQAKVFIEKGLAKGGEMGELIRSKDWSETSLGFPETWPQSLFTTLGIMLNSRFPMFLFWGQELLCFYNDAYRPSLGNDGKHPDVLGMQAQKAWPEIWDIIKPLIDQVIEKGEATWSEDQLIPFYRNGRIENIYWTFSYSPLIGESGNPEGVFVTCVETTAKVNYLKELQISRDELDFAIDATELGSWDLNPITNKFSANDRLKDWFGLKPGEEVELPLAIDVIAEKDRESVSMAIQKALDFSFGGNYHIEYTIVHPKTKEERIVRAKGRAAFDESKVAYRFSGTLQDVTEQAIARKRLKESKKELNFIIEAMPQKVWTADALGSINYFNQHWMDYTGLLQEELKSSGWGVIIHPNDLKANTLLWKKAIETGDLLHSEYRIRNKEGNYRWHLNRGVARRDSEGQIISWVGTSTDIHDQKEAHEQEIRTAQDLAAMNEELRTANEEVRASNDELAELNKQHVRVNSDLDNFIYTASHDLRAPISNIEGLVHALLRHLSKDMLQSAVVTKIIDSIQGSIGRFKKTIANLTELTKLQKGPTGETTFVNLSEVIEDVILDLQPIIQDSTASIDIMIDPNKTLQFSAKNLRSIVYNLISNAIKYHAPNRNPQVIVSGFEFLGYFVLSVKDNGLGMDLTKETKLFSMFQRLHDHVEGSGIGLYMVKKIIENAGGKIEVESQLGSGSEFKVFFKP